LLILFRQFYPLKYSFMKAKHPLLLLFAFCFLNPVSSQGILKKIKDKAAGNENSKTVENNKPKVAWCDTGLVSNTYSLAYSSPDNFTIMYDESRMGMGRNKTDYRLILKKRVDNKEQYVIIDNGKVTATVAELTGKDLAGGLRSPLSGLNTGSVKSNYDKYIVAETITATVPGQSAKTITNPQKIDANKTNQAFEMMKNTDEYKKMSAEEKKEMEEMMKQMPGAVKEYNNSGMAGKTVTIPEVKGGSFTGGTGYYSIIVKGKNYGKFAGQPNLAVSDDEANVYLVGADGKGITWFIANDKKTSLDGKNPSGLGHMGNILMSPDGKKAAFVEMKMMNEKEQEAMLKDLQNGRSPKQNFIITKSDGSTFQITRTDGADKFKLSNTGAVIFVDSRSGEVFADGKTIGKFNKREDTELNSEALLFGSDPSKICYYNDDGSLGFMDGSKKDMGILFPAAINDNGKTYITWFRKCKNDIYIGKYEF